MNKLFSTVSGRTPKRNFFDLSHEKKLSLNMGELIPIYLEEILPNDKFKVNSETLIRFHPLIAPLMHRIDAYIHYFFVPNRLVWDNWETFITGGELGNEAPPFPQIQVTEAQRAQLVTGKLTDYFGIGIPTTALSATYTLNALPYRAYQLIYNEYYRDQTLSAEIPIGKGDTVDGTEANYIGQIRKRAWAKDYFTSALPWAQRGGEVMIPADIAYKNATNIMNANNGAALGNTVPLTTDTTGTQIVAGVTTRIENIEGLDASINDLRKSIRLQEWLEKNARAGSRYVEQLLSHWGVIADDLRHMRPQYLGGGLSNVTISEVLANFGNAEIPQGNMAGHGLSVGNTNAFKKYFKEHGYVIGIMSVIPKATYQDGIPRTFLKSNKFDFAFPEFANLGEQEIKNIELYWDNMDAGNTNNNATFGYTPRYAEYKFGRNTVHGDFKTNLSFWHAGRIFSAKPSLNEAFITCDTSEIDDRIFPVADSQATNKLYVQIFNHVKALRALPKYGTPTL